MKGILFKDFLIKQIAAGAKTMTRRTKGLEVINEVPSRYMHTAHNFKNGQSIFLNMLTGDNVFVKPEYLIGEVIYVKENYIPDYFADRTTAYGTDWNSVPELLIHKPKYKSKLMMPEREARYFLTITNVRVERLKSITEADAISEGVETIPLQDIVAYKMYMPYKGFEMWVTSAVESFYWLIKSISGNGTWENNPWVWVYEFELKKRD
ncbi:MAG TPA: hypothetical protein VMW01_16455 [Williamwhitmania sp.]|nr:hypothetical protein [Williamwhitmania sp.]